MLISFTTMLNKSTLVTCLQRKEYGLFNLIKSLQKISTYLGNSGRTMQWKLWIRLHIPGQMYEQNKSILIQNDNNGRTHLYMDTDITVIDIC